MPPKKEGETERNTTEFVYFDPNGSKKDFVTIEEIDLDTLEKVRTYDMERSKYNEQEKVKTESSEKEPGS